MTRNYQINRHDSQSLDSSSGEELLLLAILGGSQTRQQIEQELGRRTFNPPATTAARPRRIAHEPAPMRLAA